MPKKIRKQKEENVVHVRLENPLPLRKGVLSTVLDAVNMLSVYENVVNLRKRRIDIINAMVGIVRDTHKELKNLENEYLPQLPAEEQREEHAIKKFLSEKPVQKQEETYDNEIERLKSEIEEIDRKLKNL